jgi:hypothetical protein
VRSRPRKTLLPSVAEANLIVNVNDDSHLVGSRLAGLTPDDPRQFPQGEVQRLLKIAEGRAVGQTRDAVFGGRLAGTLGKILCGIAMDGKMAYVVFVAESVTDTWSF